jgi:hypothetical protein
MGKIIKLTEIDIENIVKKVISEQAESNKCTGTNEIKPPFIKTEIRYKDENGKFGTGGDVPAVVKFHLRAYFPTAGSSDEVYQDALLQLKQQVEDELSSKQLNAKYDLVLVKVDNVIGSASNYLNGPLQPTHYRGKPIESSKLSSEPYVNLPKEGDSNWNKNKGYADSRWGNMVSYINKNGKSLGFGVGKDLKAPKTTEFRITDTGGCTDEKRDSNKYKGPGQYVIVNGFIKLEQKPIDEDDIGRLTECATGLKIIVGYFKQDMSAMDTGITMKRSSTNHKCDYATFTVSCNGIPVGISNMNNGEYRNHKRAMIGLNQENVERRAPEQEGDTVYSLISVSDEQLKQIIAKSKNGKVYMTIQGSEGTLLRPRSSQRPGGTYHGEAPMVCAYIDEEISGETTKRIVYGPKEPFGKGSGDVKPGVSKSMGTFNPCVTIKEV